MDIWQILQIKPTKSTEDIRNAYAAQLPFCHPEDSSKAFQNLRTAYEFALAYANSSEDATENEWFFDIKSDEAEDDFTSLTLSIDDADNTPLHYAALANDIDAVRELLANDADSDAINIKGQTALQFAVRENKINIVELLCKAGASIERADNNGNSIWYIAARYAHLEVCNMLSQFHKVNPDSEALYAAIASQEINKVTYFLKQGVNINTYLQRFDDTALLLAVRLGSVELCQLLLQHDGDVYVKNQANESALSMACMRGFTEIVSMLVASGANKVTLDTQLTAIENAVAYHNVNIVNHMLDDLIHNIEQLSNNECIRLFGICNMMFIYGYLSYRDWGYLNVMMSRVSYQALSHDQHFADMLTKQVDTTWRSNNQHFQQRFQDLRNKYQQKYLYLIENNENNRWHLEANKYQQDKQVIADEYSLAFQSGIEKPTIDWMEISQCLQQQSEDFIKNYKSLNHFSAILKAAQQSDLDKLKLLNDENINQQDECYGLTALHLAAMNGDQAMAAYLITQGANVNLATHYGWTALHAAVNAQSVECVDLLLVAGADCNQQTKWQSFTPLYIAAYHDNEVIVKQLLQHGAADLPVDFGPGCHTALMPAVYNGNLNFVKSLITLGSPTLQSAYDFRTLVFMATLYRQHEILAYLLELKVDPNYVESVGFHFNLNHYQAYPFVETPLAAAVANRDEVALNLLFQAEADPEYYICYGAPALHYATLYFRYPYSKTYNYYQKVEQCKSLISRLIEYGVDINSVDAKGRTFLHKLITFNQEELAIFLFERGADPFIENLEKQDVIAIANAKGYYALAKYLQAR